MMKRILLALVAVFVMLSGFAAPAYRKPFIVKQSDGTELTVILTGDEALHYYVTDDGKPLMKEWIPAALAADSISSLVISFLGEP
jgi:hypothetical protein